MELFRLTDWNEIDFSKGTKTMKENKQFDLDMKLLLLQFLTQIQNLSGKSRIVQNVFLESVLHFLV